MSEQRGDTASTREDEASEAGTTSEGFGNLSIEDDAEGTVDPASIARTDVADDPGAETGVVTHRRWILRPGDDQIRERPGLEHPAHLPDPDTQGREVSRIGQRLEAGRAKVRYPMSIRGGAAGSADANHTRPRDRGRSSAVEMNQCAPRDSFSHAPPQNTCRSAGQAASVRPLCSVTTD